MLSYNEEIALSHGLDQHILSRLNRNDIETEFEKFYHRLLNDISNIPGEHLSSLKTKLRSMCQKYQNKSSIQIQTECKKSFKNGKHLIIMKQGNGRGVVIVEKPKYHVKCLFLQDTNSFKKLDYNLTKKWKQPCGKRKANYRKKNT